MTTIYQKDNIAKKILGKQKVDTKKEYRLMKFCLIEKIDSETLLYNNLTKELIILSKAEIEAISNLPCRPKEGLYELISNWFIVPVDYNEYLFADDLYQMLKLVEKKDFIDNYVIFTTTNCNARCFYCFEHGIKRIDMSEKTALDVADYIIKNSKNNPINIKWFGGEPLANLNVIDIICNKLSENGVCFNTEMTTNGFLFDDNILQKSKKIWKLKSVQITLDGTEKPYNKIKSYIDSTNINPFFKVTDNIDGILENGINVTIRLNITEDNVSDLYKLVDFISRRYNNKKKLIVYAANLYDAKRKASSEDIENINNEYFKLDSYICQKGLNNYRLEKWNTFSRGCMAQRDASVVISPEGLLGKCEHFTEGEMMFGSIYTNKTDFSVIDYWKRHNRIDACYDCVVYPNCFGEGHCPNLSLKCEKAEKIVKEHNLKESIKNKFNEYRNNN